MAEPEVPETSSSRWRARNPPAGAWRWWSVRCRRRWDPWTRGIRVEARYVDRDVGCTGSGPWPEVVYVFVDPDGVRREHALRLSARFARPRPTRTIWCVPGNGTSRTLGAPFASLFITVVTGGMILALGGIALFLMPGLLIDALG
ncbi:hypothetical protein [Streptomyces sp. YIM S03343]